VLRPDELPTRPHRVFGEPGSDMVGAMIDAVVAGSLADGGAVVMSPDELDAMHELRTFMFERVYASETAAGQKDVAIDVIRRLVDHHLAHPEQIPATYRDEDADLVTQVVDHVSGMTDRFALALHDRLFDADAASRLTPLLPGR
jgi:dGTPase